MDKDDRSGTVLPQPTTDLYKLDVKIIKCKSWAKPLTDASAQVARSYKTQRKDKDRPTTSSEQAQLPWNSDEPKSDVAGPPDLCQCLLVVVVSVSTFRVSPPLRIKLLRLERLSSAGPQYSCHAFLSNPILHQGEIYVRSLPLFHSDLKQRTPEWHSLSTS